MQDVPAWLYAALRAAAQAIIPSAGMGIGTAFASQEVIVGLVVGLSGPFLYGLLVAAVRWMETRTGDSFRSRMWRAIAKGIMIGLSKYQPVYAKANPNTVAASVATERADNVPASSPVYVPTVAAVLKE